MQKTAHRNSPARADMLAARAAEQRSRRGRFMPMAPRKSLSKRGDAGETWRTKRWTAARWRDLDALDHINFDLASRLDEQFKRRAGHLRLHLMAHPTDSCATAALSKIGAVT